MRFRTLTLAALTTAALTASGSLATAKTRIIVNCFWPPQHFVCQKVLPGWLEAVEEVTEGRVVGNIPPKSVAPPPEQLASVEKGIVDASVQFNGLIGNRVNGALTAMQPFSGTMDGAAMTQAAWETRQKYYPDEFDTVELLSQWVITPGQLFSNTDEPVATVDEFKSRKMWALPGPLANMAKGIGAAVVATPAVKSNEVIANGVVDSHLGLGGDAIQSFQVIPYTKSMTRFSTPVYTTTFSFVINKDKWAEISPEDQEAIRAISQDKIGMVATGLWDSVSADVYSRFDELGITVVDADPALEATLVEAAGPITQAWKDKAKAAGIDADAALDYYRTRVKELSK
ncbi:hypothetical protein [Hoeflea poritis]|uniref:C4-dicarboxylate ABC transporter substrate-binding protein n=1 Tax=Hoeflea poritis TaxID=2993659 RepID=A0ABT4VUV3_9HYPH|nr:hypothetical protein [Hoeflea poritis]MDA4848409.1 hypothetical protein [Hoeflea poritis]